jgi:segregation and condensation protein B
VPTELIVQLLRELGEEYTLRGSGLELAEIAGGYLLRTRAALAPFLANGGSRRTSDRLSPSLLEVLAIIAYRQPVTRPQIEAIRGVDCSYAVGGLMERGLIEVTGRSDKPGRPALYATTRAFLQHFGLRDLSELLPQASEVGP